MFLQPTPLQLLKWKTLLNTSECWSIFVTKVSKSVRVIAELKLCNKTFTAQYPSHSYCSLPILWHLHLEQQCTSSSKEIIGIGKSVLFVWSFFCGNAREHAISFFVTANCLPLSLSFFQYVSYLMYDIQGQSAPIHVLNQFTKTTTVHNYNTRASSKDLFDVLKGFKNWANEKHSCKNLSWFATLSFMVLDRFVHLNFVKLWRKYFSIL